MRKRGTKKSLSKTKQALLVHKRRAKKSQVKTSVKRPAKQVAKKVVVKRERQPKRAVAKPAASVFPPEPTTHESPAERVVNSRYLQTPLDTNGTSELDE